MTQPNMTKSRSIFPALFFLSVLAVMCIALFFAADYALTAPRESEQIYGPASPNLTRIERI